MEVGKLGKSLIVPGGTSAFGNKAYLISAGRHQKPTPFAAHPHASRITFNNPSIDSRLDSSLFLAAFR